MSSIPSAEERYGEGFIKSLSTKTYRQTGGWVSFHYIEGFGQCPYYVLHKHLWHGAAEALKIPDRRGWRDDIFSASSADLLGKALMAGVASGADAAAETYRKGLKPTADKGDAKAYLSLLQSRASSASRLLSDLAHGDEIAVEYPFSKEWGEGENGLRVRGHIDTLIGREDGVDIVEIKCTDNLGFVQHASMQTFFYAFMLSKLGYKVRRTYYIIFPAWKHRGETDGLLLETPPRSERQKHAFFEKAKVVMDTPMNPALWPATGCFSKCETCQYKGKCGRM